MSQEENSQDAPNAEVQKINAIRDIIFGSDMQEYDHKFEALKTDLNATNDEIKKIISTLRKDLETKISSLEKHLEKTSQSLDNKISRLEEKLNAQTSDLKASKVDREVLGDLLEKMAKEIRPKS